MIYKQKTRRNLGQRKHERSGIVYVRQPVNYIVGDYYVTKCTTLTELVFVALLRVGIGGGGVEVIGFKGVEAKRTAQQLSTV